ncbi:16S rRNA C967 or C1407 C5-methylase, RsmB/RsmF family [Parapedobacter composti]|uniref:16S rRNA C967 or C1407 C5-methylase, RsmB/RsmF family n=1 Tax=Parapedobacter composti TaxID=623281 RepID=A0A1I1FQX1_9SPHI|nr:RNA methyltransferase [Parapedobacter composti]SFC01734.1 16S rRNA C967 or C1407 C5-methylase, RsmB/RsmF family [Parapedobacter composti]
MSNIIPPELVRRLGTFAGFDTAAFETAHRQEEGVTSIRINPAKNQGPDTTALEHVPWCDTGFYLPERPVFTLDPLFHAGCYYVQEASSMFIAHAVKALALDGQPLVALDLCAAPGGKSTLLSTYLHADSLLIANELIKSRVNILVDNMVRWGHANTVVTNNDPSAFRHLPGYVDLMLVDAPCSGSGMFRKDAASINEWSEAAVQLCSERQRRILADSLPALRAGGFLLYSTCSYSVEENEQIADWLCETQGVEPVAIPIDADWGIEQTASDKHACPGYRFYPHKLRGEGFFLAAFRKTADQPSFDRHIKADIPRPPKELQRWVADSHRYFTFSVGDELCVLPKGREADLRILQRVLYLRNAGTRVGRLAKGDIIPSHHLALSNARHQGLPTVALDKEMALEYLRKGNVPPSVNTQKLSGWTLATYRGAALGWMKLLPNRINNYYPKEWRIATM